MTVHKRHIVNRATLVRRLLQSPSRISIFSFVILISIGSVLLMLPAASNDKSLEFVDALFTATSASCVTGLVVVNTGTAWSTFGQIVILLLIQAGGLGIMTFSTLFLLMAGRRPSLADRVVIQDTFTRSGERSLLSILRDVVLFTFVIEGVGTVVLFCRFLPGKNIGEALYLSVFHSISAFCNAGFTLFAKSFVDYRNDWLLNIVLCILIISGGIGFLVLSELRREIPYNRRRWSRLSLHTKMSLLTTVGLLISSTFLILMMEWHNTLADFSPYNRMVMAFFQAVTTRTAGFNTLTIGNLTNATLFVFILLMFIGACPGSCGGGIKTTTFACLTVLGVSRLRGQQRPQVFHRTLSDASMGKAINLVMFSTVVVILGTTALLMSELGEIPHYLSRGRFLEVLFEVVSAFGTVGLSTGFTGELSWAGKLIITMVMFVGRLGPLVVAVAIYNRGPTSYHYAEENIIIG